MKYELNKLNKFNTPLLIKTSATSTILIIPMRQDVSNPYGQDYKAEAQKLKKLIINHIGCKYFTEALFPETDIQPKIGEEVIIATAQNTGIKITPITLGNAGKSKEYYYDEAKKLLEYIDHKVGCWNFLEGLEKDLPKHIMSTPKVEVKELQVEALGSDGSKFKGTITKQ